MSVSGHIPQSFLFKRSLRIMKLGNEICGYDLCFIGGWTTSILATWGFLKGELIKFVAKIFG